MILRQTKYTPEIGVKILELMEQGLSLFAACGEVNVGRTTAYEWIDRHPEFASLIELAKQKRQNFLERRLMNDSATGPMATSTIFALKNASADWREDLQSKVQIDQTINHNHTLKLDSLSADQLEQLALMLGGSKDSEPLVIEHNAED